MRRAKRVSSLRVLLRHLSRERRRMMRDVAEAITGRQRTALLEQRIGEVKDELRRMDEGDALHGRRIQRRADRDILSEEPRVIARAEVGLWSTPESGVPLER